METTTKEKMKPIDPHSYTIASESKVTHLDWTAEVSFEEKKISGIAKLSIENSPKAEKLTLDTKGLKITKVSIADKEVEYTLSDADEILGSKLEIPIKPATTEVTIIYSTSEGAEALQWLEPVQTAGKEHPFLFTQSQAILARSWVPIQDSPGIRFSYNAKVTVPKGLMALMSAENPQTVSEDGVYHFKMAQPIPAYLFALAVGKLDFKSTGKRSGVYAESGILEKAAAEFEDLEQMIDVAEGLYGPYRWDRYDLLVLPPSFPFGGMENPRLTFATPTILAGDKSLVSLVAHELAHSWSGNLVTNATWNDFWLNEGFTVYFEQRIMEALYGRDYSEMLASLAYGDLVNEVKSMTDEGHEGDTHLKLDLNERNPDDGVTSIAYDKGYLFLRTIEEQVGRGVFDKFLKNYFEENAFKVMDTESFLAYTDEKLLTNSESIDIETLKKWIYESGIPKDHAKPSSTKFEQVERTLEQWMSNEKFTAVTADWTSHEWQHFVRQLPKQISNTQMAKLDELFAFTESGNSEVLTAWLTQAISHDYKPAYERLEKFLVNTGRRKFLVPLYSELVKTEGGRKMAKEIYSKARPNYHFVSTNTLDDLLEYKQNQ